MAIVVRPEPGPRREGPTPNSQRPQYSRLWFGFLGAAAAWSVHEIVGYAITAHSCYPDLTPYTNPQTPASRWISLGISVVLLVVALLSLLVAVSQWRTWRTGPSGSWRDALMEASAFRAYRYLAFSGILLGVIFSAIIAYSVIATLVLQTCSY